MGDQIAGHLRGLHFDGNITDGDNSSGGERLSSLFCILVYYESFDRGKGRLLLNCFSERFCFLHSEDEALNSGLIFFLIVFKSFFLIPAFQNAVP